MGGLNSFIKRTKTSVGQGVDGVRSTLNDLEAKLTQTEAVTAKKDAELEALRKAQEDFDGEIAAAIQRSLDQSAGTNLSDQRQGDNVGEDEMLMMIA